MQDAEVMPATRRLGGVDVLRGVSILAVVLLHFYLRLHFADVKVRGQKPKWLFHLLLLNGNNGVVIFFAVSGFLITLTSMRRFGTLGAMRPRLFYRIRFARIAPLLLGVLLILSVLHLTHVQGFVINAKKASLPLALGAALTFTLNWLEAARGYLPANWDVLWSLSIEEMFYLFFPLVCVGLLRFRRGKAIFATVLLGFVAMGPLARVLATNEIWQEKSYLGGMDAVALGCLAALALDPLRRWVAGRSALPVAMQGLGVASIALVFDYPHWAWLLWLGDKGLDATLLPVGACLFMLGSVLRAGSGGGVLLAPVRWFGRQSYEVYMTHEFVVVAATELYLRWPHGPLWVWFVGVLGLAAGLGWVVARTFSEPMNRRLRGVAQAS